MEKVFEKFQKDLPDSVKQMKRGRAARTIRVRLTTAAEDRATVRMSRQEFAELLGVSPRTLQDCEQGRREPTGAARTLLEVAVKHPRVLRQMRG